MTSALSGAFEMRTCIQERPARGVSPSLLLKMASRIRAFSPDLVHVRGLGNEGFHGAIAAKLAGCRRVLVSIHGSQRALQAPASPLRTTIVARALEPMTLWMADGIMTVCEATARAPWLSSHQDKFLGVIHNGTPIIDDPEVQAIAVQRASSGDRTVVLFFGRVTVEKGVNDLAAAIELLDTDPLGSQLLFRFVGDGDQLSALRRRLGRCVRVQVEFHGQLSDARRAFEGTDVFVFPSWHENLPNSLLEAMAFGLPVIATRVGGVVEVIEHGRTGLLLEPHQPAELAHAIRTLHGDRAARARLSSAARNEVRSRFSIQLMAERHHRVYMDMISDRRYG